LPFTGSPEALRECRQVRIEFLLLRLSRRRSLIEAKGLMALAVQRLKAQTTAWRRSQTTLEAGYPNSNYIFWIGVLRRRQHRGISPTAARQIAKLSDPAMKELIQEARRGHDAFAQSC